MKRPITIEEVQDVSVTPQSLMGPALRQTPDHISVGKSVFDTAAFLNVLNTGNCGCLVTLPFVPDDDILQRIHRLTGKECDDAGKI